MAANQHAHHAPAPVGGSLFNAATLICGVLIAIMAAILVVRFIFGLGAVTNLNDGYPWGIWVVVDVVIGRSPSTDPRHLVLLRRHPRPDRPPPRHRRPRHVRRPAADRRPAAVADSVAVELAVIRAAFDPSQPVGRRGG